MRMFRTTLLLATLSIPGIAQAVPDISASAARQTGVAPFDANDAPGNDSGPSNAVIRTNDVIAYTFEVVVRDDDATNVILRLSTGPGLEIGLPAFCRETGVTPVSAVTGSAATGSSVLCNVGDIDEGAQVVYALPASVAHDMPNGGTVSMTGASVESDQTAPVFFPDATDTVSAVPGLDLVKADRSSLLGRRDGPNGEDGVVYAFPLHVVARDAGRGQELVTDTLSFDDDLSSVSPNARLYQGWPGAYADACMRNYAVYEAGLSSSPAGSVRTADGGPGGDGANVLDRSVWNSGDISCTPTGPGGTTTVTVTGADLSGIHHPTRSAGGAAIPADLRYLVSGVVTVWIPVSDITDAGGRLAILNTYSPLRATSISGQSNVEPDLDNNAVSFTARDAGGRRWFHNQLDYDRRALLQGQTTRRSGNGYVLPDQIFGLRHYQNNEAWLSKATYDNYIGCITFDNTTQRITEITPGQGAVTSFEGTPEGVQPPFVVEYGTGAFGPGPGAVCGDGDSPAGWHASMDDVPGGAAAITKIRAKTDFIAAPGGSTTVYRAVLQARMTALDNPVGTIVAHYAVHRNDYQNNGMWYVSDYDKDTATGLAGDRLFLTKVAVRIDKDTDPAGENQVLAGDALAFRLRPSATVIGTPPDLRVDVTVTDTLPEWYSYTIGSSTPPPASFARNPDGTTTMVWNFPDTVINQPMAEINYGVTVMATAPDRTSAVNTVVISSPNDGIPLEARTDSHSILVLNPSGFAIDKIPLDPIVDPSSGYAYEVVYANTGSSDFAGVQVIDILPDPRVALSPSTVFDGSSTFVSATGTGGETFEYTRADPATIEGDPGAASNQPGGATVWCTGFGGAGCPANAAAVTGLRATSGLFAQGQPARRITISMDATANGALNVYSSNVTARAEGLAFAVTSPTATVFVRTADVSLTKDVAIPDPAAPEVATFTIRAANTGPHAATGTRITDLLPSGYVYRGHAGDGTYDPASGVWTPGDIAVEGSRILTLNVGVVRGGDYLNTAQVTAQDHADPDSTPGNAATAPGEDDTASTGIAAVSGRVFLDNGAGGGTAHDGAVTGTEAGGLYGTVALRDTATATVRAMPRIAVDGTWFAALADALPGTFEAVFTSLPTHIAISEGGAGLPGLVNPDPADGLLTFSPVFGGDYAGADFGVIAGPTLVLDSVSAIGAGQVVAIPHRYEATSAGSVTFSLAEETPGPDGGFTTALFGDPGCDGTLGAPLSAPVTVMAGQSVCLVARTQAAGGIGAGAVRSYALLAATSFADSAVTHLARNIDRLDVAAGGDRLVLRKMVRNVTAGTPEMTTNTGDLGDVLEYRLILSNPDARAVSDVTVSDVTPSWTVLSSAVPVSTPVSPGIVCALSVPGGSANLPGYAGPLRWSCPGAFPPGGSGSLTFRVVIVP